LTEGYNQALYALHYRKGFLIREDSTGEINHIAALIVRFESDTLLVRVDVEKASFSEDEVLEFAIPGETALFLIAGTVKDVRFVRWGMLLLSLEVNEVREVQRRLTKRYETILSAQYYTKYVDDTSTKNYGEGKVFDISLGGMKLETADKLPHLTPMLFFVWSPVGSMQMEGKIITERKNLFGRRVYGVEFSGCDSITSYRLNKHIHNMSQINRSSGTEERSGKKRHRF
jgi:hypothetical protein